MYVLWWTIQTLRRTAFVARELLRFNFDIVALSKFEELELGLTLTLRGTTKGRTRSLHFFFWKSLYPKQPRIHGVGFAIRNSLLPKLTDQPEGINERLMTLRIQLVKSQHATIISADGPTLDSYDKVKETLYEQLDNHLLWTGTIGKRESVMPMELDNGQWNSPHQMCWT